MLSRGNRMVEKNIIMEKFCRRDPSGKTLMTPFVVNKKKKILYFHIAKTGGSSIVKILRDSNLDDMVLSSREVDWDAKKMYFEDVAEHWGDYYKFTFIRNKYSLLVSNWHYDNKKLQVSFEKFVKDIVMPSRDNYDYWIDQYYITTADGESIFDFIGQQENFSKHIKIPFDKIGVREYDSKKRMNNGRYNKILHYSSYYNEELKQLVDEKFKQEIEHFNFKMGKS